MNANATSSSSVAVGSIEFPRPTAKIDRTTGNSSHRSEIKVEFEGFRGGGLSLRLGNRRCGELRWLGIDDFYWSTSEGEKTRGWWWMTSRGEW